MALFTETTEQRVRVKICGITNLEDALAACTAGADALGFVFYPDSPRYIEPQKADTICQQLPADVTKVGLFVNAEANTVKQIISTIQLDLLQFHGSESADFCKAFTLPWMKAVRMKDDIDLYKVCHDYADGEAILLDSYVPGKFGGTGESFCWKDIPADLPKRIVLAGGLQADNVKQAITVAKPYAVDVSGGVERQKGRKDHDKIRQFINEVFDA